MVQTHTINSNIVHIVSTLWYVASCCPVFIKHHYDFLTMLNTADSSLLDFSWCMHGSIKIGIL